MLSPSFSDWFGFGVGLLWCVFALWLINRIIRSEDNLLSVFTTWPRTGPRGFRVWLVFAAAIMAALCLMLRVDTSSVRLARRHETVPGTFVRYESDHGQFRYTFLVRGLRYHGYDSSNEHALSQIEAGAPFEVYYDPANPNVSTVSEPGHRAAIEKVSLIFFGAFVTGLLAVLIRKLGALVQVADAPDADFRSGN